MSAPPYYMSTINQKRVARHMARNILEGKVMTGSEILRQEGYKPSLQKNPSYILDSVGVKKEMAKMGFNELNASNWIIKAVDKGSPDVAIRGAQEVFKVFGTYAPQKTLSASIKLQQEIEQDRIKYSKQAKKK